MGRALDQIEVLKMACEESGHPALQKYAEQFNPCVSIRERIKKVLNPDAPALLSKGNYIADGVDAELDDLRNLSRSGKEYLMGIQRREMELTGISSLKVGYNNVFGYYLEVTNAHKDKVPAEWIRKQTLTNAERYITEELKQYEQKILGAEEKIAIIEQRLYNELVTAVTEFVEPIQVDASLVARIDCLVSFADISLKYNYVRPAIDDSFVLDIKDGRHPVIEQMMPVGESYIANDVYLDRDKQQIIIITSKSSSSQVLTCRVSRLCCDRRH